MIIDVHTHVGEGKTGLNSLQLLESMKKHGVTKSLVFPLKSQRDVFEHSLELRDLHQDLLPVLRCNPKVIDRNILVRVLDDFVAIKLHPRGEDFDPLDEQLSWFFKILSEKSKPIIIHTRKEGLSSTDPERLLTLAKRYPKIPFVFGHFAGDSDEFFSRMQACDNVYVETSIVSSPFIIKLRAKQVGADRIMFGSDVPFSDHQIEILKVLKSELTQEEKNLILHGNAIRVFNLKI
ncbi:MAG: amidohydrolase family protein [Nanoarchaeota archaeon]